MSQLLLMVIEKAYLQGQSRQAFIGEMDQSSVQTHCCETGKEKKNVPAQPLGKKDSFTIFLLVGKFFSLRVCLHSQVSSRWNVVVKT